MKNKKDTIILRDNCVFSPNIFKAIKFATKTHEIYQKQKRKHKDIPYITHPLTVGLILARAGAPENIIIAGILHDTMEDGVAEHKVTRAMLDERFVDSVGNIVEGVTEPNKELPWHERKQLALEHIKIINGPTLWVKSADVISNVSEILDDYGHDGDDVFSRFNAPKKDIIANYIAVLRALIKRLEKFDIPLIVDLEGLVFEVEELAIESTPKPTQCFLWWITKQQAKIKK
ncbi:HD domain-containing protein [Patescibacteria group bacterium]|nr:HD domain-containing protein [Patescibacteria group bacterium]